MYCGRINIGDKLLFTFVHMWNYKIAMTPSVRVRLSVKMASKF